MEWGFLEGIGVILMIWLGYRMIKNIVEENHEKTMQTIINVGLALGMTKEEAYQVLQTNIETDKEKD